MSESKDNPTTPTTESLVKAFEALAASDPQAAQRLLSRTAPSAGFPSFGGLEKDAKAKNRIHQLVTEMRNDETNMIRNAHARDISSIVADNTKNSIETYLSKDGKLLSPNKMSEKLWALIAAEFLIGHDPHTSPDVQKKARKVCSTLWHLYQNVRDKGDLPRCSGEDCDNLVGITWARTDPKTGRVESKAHAHCLNCYSKWCQDMTTPAAPAVAPVHLSPGHHPFPAAFHRAPAMMPFGYSTMYPPGYSATGYPTGGYPSFYMAPVPTTGVPVSPPEEGDE